MTLIAPARSAPRFGKLLGGTVIGVLLAAAGLVAGYLAIATPFVTMLLPDAPSGGRQVAFALGIWSFSLIASGALLVAGTNRLAIILAMLRHPDRRRGPAARALASMSDELVVATGIIPLDGRSIPELVIGSFGMAIIHELPSSRNFRRVAGGWEVRTNAGWMPADDPLDLVARDAEWARHWLARADLDFVVRVYGALVVRDQAVERTANCAVIAPRQIPAWIASMPRQRTLTPGRRGRLLAITRSMSGPH